jgi:hypothetical protein
LQGDRRWDISVGGESSKDLLEDESWAGADLEVMYLEDSLALFDASLDGLTTIVGVEPVLQVLGDVGGAVMEQDGTALLLSGVVVSQGHIHGIGQETFDGCVGPGGEEGVPSDLLPLSLGCDGIGELLSHLAAARLGVEVVAHLQQPVDVLLTGETTIQTEDGPDGAGMGVILRRQ